MRKLLLSSVFLCVLCGSAFSQNLATVSGANIEDLNGAKLANGQICFLGTDQGDNPISFQVGGGGQALRRQYCAQVSNGAIASFTVPNPAATLPTGIYYRVTVKDTSTGQELLRYTGVTFTGGTFNFDTYSPNPPGFSPAPLSGNSVTGNLGVTGNISASGTIAGSNIPATIPGTGSCTNEFVSALNTAAPPTCSTAPLTTLGDILYESSPTALGRVPGNTTTTKKYLQQVGTGTASAAPSWQQIAAADLSDGNTGAGSIVHGASPAIATPSISSPSTTGTDSGTETLTNKTLTSPAVTNPSTTGTDGGAETLKNKDLVAASSGNNVTLLSAQNHSTAITGTGSAVTLYTFSIPANTVATGKVLHIRAGVQHSTGTASVTYSLSLNGVAVLNLSSTATGNVIYDSTITAESSTAIAETGTVITSAGVTPSVFSTTGFNFAAAQTLSLTFTVANTDAVTPILWEVDVIQ